jgi:hypothetical protein
MINRKFLAHSSGKFMIERLESGKDNHDTSSHG